MARLGPAQGGRLLGERREQVGSSAGGKLYFDSISSGLRHVGKLAPESES